MHLLRRYAGYWLVLVLGVGTWAAVYAYDEGFSKKWRNLIMGEFERRGIEAEIGKLTIDPIDGLVARNVKIFATEKRKSVVASINNITLDIDLAKLLRKELFLNTIKLRDADISLPINPMQPDTERLEIKNLSARIQISGNRFEIEQAECLFNGFKVTLVGSLLQPEFNIAAESKNQRLEKLGLIRQRREVFAHIAREMRRFQSPRNHPPHIHIELRGDLEHPETIEATLHLSGSNVRRNNYYCKTLDIRAEYHHPDILIDQIKITDNYGELYADAKWRIGSEKIPFSLKSSVDSHALLQSLLETSSLGEVVFFDPPELEAKGAIYVAGEKARSTHRMQVVGNLECSRFASRGKIFERAHADFSIDPERWYVRNLFLGHKSGTASGNALSETSGKIRYDATIEMDPTTFTPFFPEGKTQDLLNRFHFDANPALYVHFSGAGPSTNPDHWNTTGHCRIGHCTYRDFPLVGVSGRFKIHAQDITFQDFRIEPEEGQNIDGKLARFLGNEELVILQGLRGKAYPAQVAAYFAPETAEVLARYHFESPPDLTLEGTIDSSGHGRSHFTSTFHSPGSAGFTLFQRELPIIAPEGTVTMDGSMITIDVKGDTLGGKVSYQGSVGVASQSNDIQGHLQAEDINFGQLASLYELLGTETGGKLQCNLEFDVPGNTPEKWSGQGTVQITHGDIFSMPFMGGISRQFNANLATRTASLPFLISSVLERTQAGLSEDATIDSSFRNEGDGIVHIDDFKGIAPGFSLQAKGKINTLKVKDQLDITAEMNARGPLKIVGWPIAKLFKYQCEGSLDAPIWRPVNFTLPQQHNADGKGAPGLILKARDLLPIPRLIIRPENNKKADPGKNPAEEPDEAAPTTSD
jgi:hypothetical protein